MRIPVVMIIILILVSFIIDLYIYFDVRHYTKKRALRLSYMVSSVACWFFLIVMLSLPRRDENSSISLIMWGLYSYCSVYFAKICYVLFSIIGRFPLIFRRERLNMGGWIGLPVGIIMFVAMWWGALFTRYDIDVVNVHVKSEKLPQVFDGYRILQFSDAHVGTWGNDPKFLQSLVDSINAQNVDLIVFTGDIVNRKSDELLPFVDILSGMKARDGVISILGNHDYGDYISWSKESDKLADRKRLFIIERKMGWRLLNNERRWLRRGSDSIMIVGVENWGEPPFHQYGDLNKALPASRDSMCNQNDDNFKILLSHNPEHWNMHVSKETNIDLTLSGHTHAMQFMIKFGEWKWSPSEYRYKQWGGLYERNNNDGKLTRLYVNIGCGEVAIPARIGANPEITVITLTR